VNSGNRTSFIAALAFFGAFAAADAGRVGESSTGAMRVAPELLGALKKSRVSVCTRWQTNGRVVFEWHPATGELSFAGDGLKPPVTLPEDLAPEPLAAATQSCGSR